MKCVAFAFAIALSFAALPRVASSALDERYALQKTSTYEDGCFGPCMCPVFVSADLRGRFSLIPAGTENGYDVFAVNNAQWFVTLWDGSTIFVQGSGTYRSSTTDKLQRLEMDLVVGDRPVQHYDSGLVPIQVPSPYINVTISRNNMYCVDTAFALMAAPAPSDLRPPKLQFERSDVDREAMTTWGRLKKLWAH